MDRYTLPTTVTINENEYKINSDFRNILRIFQCLQDPDLLESEKLYCALNLFYDNDFDNAKELFNYLVDIETALNEMMLFINCGESEIKQSNNQKPLYDWEQDYNIIVAPINRILGVDVRGLPYLHWWTFFSAFMEIGECTFSTFVSIRDKLNRGKKLEKYEEKILKDNRDKIILKKKYDTTTQDLLDEVMGKGV